jgi:hypothetical protein
MHDDIIILLRIRCFHNSAFEVALSSVTEFELVSVLHIDLSKSDHAY